jgi:spore germination protein YaaH
MLESGSLRRFTDAMYRQAPEVKVVAWVYAGNTRGEGEVDLMNVAVRGQMIREAKWLVEECGFDGIQWDYEICRENEPGFLNLLQETRSALPGVFISIATPLNMPWPLGGYGWSEQFYSRVAAHCDQICVMGYDSGAWLPRTYAWLIHRQAVTLTRAIAKGKPDCRLLIGLPTYGKGFVSHNPGAENIAIALKGVREGLADHDARPEVCEGVALFADYTTDPKEWGTYDRLWLEP